MADLDRPIFQKSFINYGSKPKTERIGQLNFQF